MSLFLFFMILADEIKIVNTPVAKLDIAINPGDLYAMAVDESGNFYATVLLEPLIQAFSPDGKKRPSLGKAGRGPGEFQYPMALTYSDGYLYTVDNGRGLLYKVHPGTGGVEKEWPLSQANAISVKGSKAFIAFNAPQNKHMFGLAMLSDKLDFEDFLYDEGCCLDVKGAKQGGMCFDGEGGLWMAYSGEYRLSHVKDGKIIKQVTKAPDGYVVPTPLTNVSRFDRKAESKHYISFDKIRGIFRVGNHIYLYRAKSMHNGNLDVYSSSGEFVMSTKLANNIVPFQSGENFIYAFMADENDNIFITKIFLNRN